jgi:hypothetical protein
VKAAGLLRRSTDNTSAVHGATIGSAHHGLRGPDPIRPTDERVG